MARVGRGRSRGGRILDISELAISHRGMGHGRIMAGRGISVLTDTHVKDEPNQHLQRVTIQPTEVKKEVLEEEAKKTLETQLTDLEKTKKGSFIHIALNYFESTDNAEYFIDKVMNSLLRSSFMVEKFTMSFRLITLLKSHGDSIKLKMFSKLQSTFQDMLILMKDSDSLSEVERDSVRCFSDLLGQLFFRFRLHLDSLQRYNVLAAPASDCMSYLVTVRGNCELLTLVKLIILNYSDLYELQKEKMEQLSLDIRSALIHHATTDLERTWLLCAQDLISYQDTELPAHLTRFYANALEQGWTEAVPTSPTQLLADIPPDIVDSKMDKFNVLVEDYVKHRFVAL